MIVHEFVIYLCHFISDIFISASAALLNQMNSVMRASARFILQKSRNSHITVEFEMNTRLHWLDIRARIDYKLCVTTYHLPVLEWTGSSISCQALHSGFIRCWSDTPALNGIRNVGGTSMLYQDVM